MANDVSTDKDLTDTISDFLTHKKQVESVSSPMTGNHVEPVKLESKNLEEVVEQFDKLEVASKVEGRLNTSTPPPSPADYKVDNNVDIFKQSFQVANGKFFLFLL